MGACTGAGRVGLTSDGLEVGRDTCIGSARSDHIWNRRFVATVYERHRDYTEYRVKKEMKRWYSGVCWLA